MKEQKIINKSGYICEVEAEYLEKIFISNDFDSTQKEYYKKKVLARIEELKPLVNECIEKNISLQELDNDINNEWNRLIVIRNRYCL